MRKYTVLAVLAIQAGATLGLTGKQAAPRAHQLKPVKVDPRTGDGTYEVLERTEFKVGEAFATDAELNKQLATMVEPADAAKAKVKAVEKGEAKKLAELEGKAKALDELKSEFERLGISSFDALVDVAAKAKLWDDVQPELEQLRAKAAQPAAAADPGAEAPKA